jgi:hypothetical protein
MQYGSENEKAEDAMRYNRKAEMKVNGKIIASQDKPDVQVSRKMIL